MAPLDERLKKKIRAEASCGICDNFYTQPVLLSCGTSFCRACVEQQTAAACPDCDAAFDPSRLRPNPSLANLVQIARELLEREERPAASSPPAASGEQPPKTFFCKAEKTLISQSCSSIEEHRGHDVVLADQAAQQYRFHIQKCLPILKKEEKDILSNKTTLEADCRYFFDKVLTAGEKIKTEFQKMEEFVEGQKRELLAQVTQVFKEIKINKNQQVFALSEKLAFIQDVILEMESAAQLPEKELLEEIGHLLQWFDSREKVQPTGSLSPDLQNKIFGLMDIQMFLLGSMKHFKETVTSGLNRHKGITSPNPDGSNLSVITSEEPQSASNLDQAQPSHPGSSGLQSE